MEKNIYKVEWTEKCTASVEAGSSKEAIELVNSYKNNPRNEGRVKVGRYRATKLL